MNIEKTIDSLKANGFTEYESKVYLSLLKHNPANGNMIALSSGVPGPKVYETLRKLHAKGYVYLFSGGDRSNSKSYIPMPYRDLLKLFEDSFNENLNLLSKGLKNISTSNSKRETELFHIDGYEASLNLITNEIALSSAEIYLSGWSVDVAKIFKPLLKAHKDGVKINSVIFGDNSLEVPWTNIPHYDVDIFNQRHSNEMNIVFDQKKTIIFNSSTDDGYSVVSDHQAMINTTTNYIRHDMYVNMIIHDFEKQLLEKYGEEFNGLIKMF
ncbi:helix-turn-helix domain-containing protein [Sporosarcina sp. FSL W7-1349]|uniref:TrmB family transcriptional regulator n=1 Tax=Sporosarcina sp. FSL W7-1349 TaxID=2921561 RepID=UPI0030F7DF07